MGMYPRPTALCLRFRSLLEESKPGRSKEEIYLELAKLAHQAFENRRSLEWRAAFALWTGIGAVTYFAVHEAGAVSGWAVWFLAAAYVMIGLGWWLVWHPLLRQAFDKDKAWKHYYMHRAEARPVEYSARDPWRDEQRIPLSQRLREHFSEVFDPWTVVQGIATVIFLAVSFAIIRGSSDRATAPDTKDVISISGQNVTKVIDKATK